MNKILLLFVFLYLLHNPVSAQSNKPPRVNAGTDRSITLPTNSLLLNGTASDDGPTLTIRWSAVSGPSGVVFNNPNAASTNVSFPGAGTFTLRLSASDTKFTRSDDVMITVFQGTNQPPVVNAGADKLITLPVNSIAMTGTATDDGLPIPPGTLTRTWSQASGPGTASFANISSPTTTVTFPVAGTYRLVLTGSDSQLIRRDTVQVIVNPTTATNQAPVVNAGADKLITLPVNSIAMTGTATDDGLPNPPGTLTRTWSQSSGPGTVSFANISSLTTTVTFPVAGTYRLVLTGSDSQLIRRDTVQVIVNPTTATNQAPVVNAGVDKSITLPVNSIAMTGTATDDGLPNPPGTLTRTWSQSSGPGTVSFANISSPTTTVTFPVAGTYRLVLTGSDSQLIRRDTVQVVVNQITGNTPPVVNAGLDQNIVLPNGASLNGQVTDNSQLNALVIRWTQVSGPVGVTFANPSSAVTSVVFPAASTFVLRLSASDGEFNSTDDVTIRTTSSTSGSNQVPVLTAGSDKFIVLPLNTVTLNGSATDDGLPIPPAAINITWSQLSGPALSTIANIKTPATDVTFTSEGTYRFQLRVSDGAIIRTDTVFVVVNPQPVIPNSLKTVQVPGPDKVAGFDFTQFVVNTEAAIRLGKILFWDMQIGSDGKVACASCHFQAGADVRSKNQLHPGGSSFLAGKGANSQLTINDFPLSINKSNDDIVGSNGVFNNSFRDILAGSEAEQGTLISDGIFNVSGVNVRRVTRRNSPSVINAVYSYRNFYDGRANPVFNGVNPFGPRDPNARVLQVSGASVIPVSIAIPLSSLASQAVGPPLDHSEMSFDGRTFRKLGKKLLSLRPLAKQLVSTTDSRLGSLAANPSPGLISTVTYASLIQQAFNSKWWNSNKVITFSGNTPIVSDPTGNPLTTDQFTLMEANFSLFFGLAIQLYEATLVSNDSKFDRFREGITTFTAQETRGMNLFMNKGRCISCHNGPEFTNASVTAKNRFGAVDRMLMKNGTTALYDIGFYNIGIRATNEDLSLGIDLSGLPLSYVKQLTSGNRIDTFSVNTARFQVPGAIQANERIAVNGAFKVPTLRNIELTGPYFHNGGKATLKELMIAYNAGNLFRNENINNLPPDITALNLTSAEEDDIIAFMLTLTDQRVKNQQAPFDHPQLVINNGHPGDQNFVTNDGTGKATDALLQLAAVGSVGGTPLSPFLNGNPFLGKAGAEGEEPNETEEEAVPEKFTLEQNFPNPFNPTTTIRYKLPAESNVKLIIYNMLGEEVVTLVNEFQAIGSYDVTWNAANISSGVYIYRIEAKADETNSFIDVKKMMFIK